jgi:hypothetical protein
MMNEESDNKNAEEDALNLSSGLVPALDEEALTSTDVVNSSNGLAIVSAVDAVVDKRAETEVKYANLLEKRDSSMETLMKSKTLATTMAQHLDGLLLKDGLVLLSPKPSAIVSASSIYMTVAQFDEEGHCIFRACAFDHIGNSNMFVGAILQDEKLRFAISDDLASYDGVAGDDNIQHLPKIVWIEGVTAFKAFHSNKYTGTCASCRLINSSYCRRCIFYCENFYYPL